MSATVPANPGRAADLESSDLNPPMARWFALAAKLSAKLFAKLSVTLFVTLSIAGSLAACSFVPAWQRPAVPLPAQWPAPDSKRPAGTAPAGTALSATVPVESQWWRAYGDPALDTLVVRALAHNFTLAQAVATVDAARANARVAGAPLLPALTLNGSVDRGHSPTSNSSAHKQSLFAQASYEIDFWGLHRANADSAAMRAEASAFDRDTAALTLTASVVDTYFQLQSLRRRVALAQSVADDARQLLALLVAQQAAGVATELQVQQQRNALATFEAAVPVLQTQQDQNAHLLATLLGEPPGTAATPGTATTPIESIAVPQARANLPAALLDMRPDIRAQEARLKAANFDIGAARAAFLPNLALTADGGFGSPSLAHFLANPLGYVAASLSAPLFEGGALSGQLAINEALVREAAAGYRQTVLTALQDVEDALSASAQQALAEASEAQAAEAAAKAAGLAQASYGAGTVDFLTVLDAQRTRYQSEDALVQAHLARLQASVGLFRAFGGGCVSNGCLAQNPQDSQNPPNPQNVKGAENETSAQNTKDAPLAPSSELASGASPRFTEPLAR
ncbi:efflux transporter outer membrane subunit [Paraburkholderia acidisoli]|uniref:Efflux transporter outer membrane subunit n=1 Tax=Paraburkholderia acidisoli TaxID=2571748 RepID=A0A7Z2GPP5_9BURK|nr:efflux transporter outer membrane subunit [Paraburkholderia acidisoli]QGZ65667.1 efflux transporter outer membrane subunit [Paraburkholderia acidisoli]